MRKNIVRVIVVTLIAVLILEPGTVQAFSALKSRRPLAAESIRTGCPFSLEALSAAALWMLLSQQPVIASEVKKAAHFIHPAAVQLNLLHPLQTLWHSAGPYLWIVPVLSVLFLMVHLIRKWLYKPERPARTLQRPPRLQMKDIHENLQRTIAELESWTDAPLVTPNVLTLYRWDRHGKTWQEAVNSRLHAALTTHPGAGFGAQGQNAFGVMLGIAADRVEEVGVQSILENEMKKMDPDLHASETLAGWMLAVAVIAALRNGKHSTVGSAAEDVRKMMREIDEASSSSETTEEATEPIEIPVLDAQDTLPFVVRGYIHLSDVVSAPNPTDSTPFKLMALPLMGLSPAATRTLEEMLGFPALLESMAYPAEYYVFGREDRPIMIARKSGLRLYSGVITTIDFVTFPGPAKDDPLDDMRNAITRHFNVPIEFILSRPPQFVAVGLSRSPGRIDIILGTKEKPGARPKRNFPSKWTDTSGDDTVHSYGFFMTLGIMTGMAPIFIIGLAELGWFLIPKRGRDAVHLPGKNLSPTLRAA